MNFNFIVLAIASLSHLTISFLSLSKQKNRISISFSLLSFCLSLWTILYAITYWVGDSGATLFFTRILTIPSFFYPSIFLYLTNVFPEDEDRFRCFFYIYHISFIAYFLFHFNSNDYINSAKMIDNNINFNAGYIYFILGVYILTTMFYGCILLFRKLKFLSVIGRKQVGFVIAGALISIIFGGIFGILLPSYGVSDYNFFAPAGTIFVILFWYYAITKHELMDIKLVITRIGSYVAVIGFLTFMLFMTQFSDLPLLIKTLLLTVIAIFFAIFGDKFREKIQTSAVRKWVSDWYNSDQLISRVLEKLVAVLNREDVFNVIAKEIYDTIKVEKVLTFLAIREAKTDEIISYSFPQKNATYGLSDPLILFALQQKEPLLFMLKDSVIADDIAQFNLRRSVALVPFWIKDELDAFLLVDQKSSEVAYIEKDKIVFRMLSIQGSMALDRIRPFEENLKKLYDTERQLAISEK